MYIYICIYIYRYVCCTHIPLSLSFSLSSPSRRARLWGTSARKTGTTASGTPSPLEIHPTQAVGSAFTVAFTSTLTAVGAAFLLPPLTPPPAPPFLLVAARKTGTIASGTPSVLNPHPKPQTLNPKPHTPPLKSQPPNPKPQSKSRPRRLLGVRGPWSVGNLNLVDCFPQASQAL